MKSTTKRKTVFVSYECATTEQYREWVSAARSFPPPESSWFCTDCTPAYQQEMILQRKCARPSIKFQVTREEGVVGYLPSTRKTQEVLR